MSEIIRYDKDAMVLLNMGEFHNVGLDFFFWTVSQILIWLPVAFVFFYVISKNKNWRETLLLTGVIVLLFTLSDQISSSILKPLIARPRPSHDVDIETLLNYVYGYKGGAFGFPSSHAANSFAFAVFSSLLFKNRIYTASAALWALTCSYSRIYLGVHFPCDVIVGAIIGACVAFGCHSAYLKLRERLDAKYRFSAMREVEDGKTSPEYESKDVFLIVIVLSTLFFAIAFGGWQLR